MEIKSKQIYGSAAAMEQHTRECNSTMHHKNFSCAAAVVDLLVCLLRCVSFTQFFSCSLSHYGNKFFIVPSALTSFSFSFSFYPLLALSMSIFSFHASNIVAKWFCMVWCVHYVFFYRRLWCMWCMHNIARRTHTRNEKEFWPIINTEEPERVSE